MRATAEWLSEALQQSSTALLFDVAVKATILVLVAIIFLRLRPRSSAALRHRVWCLVFCGLVFLPVLCYVLPGWAVPILPSRTLPSQGVAAGERAQAANEANDAGASAVEREDRGSANDGTNAADNAHAEATIGSLQNDRSEQAMAGDAGAGTGSASARPAADASRAAAMFDPLAIWLVGAAVAVLPWIAGIARSIMLRAKARTIQDESWTALRDQLCARLGLARTARLLEVDAPIIPLSCGVVRPAVVLPQVARHWNARLRRSVLLHELSHIKRHDVAFQLLGRLVCALYWFHPLVWYAMHRLRVERELACDDSVLAAGERPSDYAEQLLEVARRLQPIRLHAAVAMAQSSKLEYRVGLLFSCARSHLPLSSWASRLLLLCAAGIVIAVSVVRPSARATDDERATEKGQKESVEEPAPTGEKAKPGKIAGRVIAHDGKAVGGARVLVVRLQNKLNTRQRTTEPVTETVSDGEGRFEMPYPAEPPLSGFYLFATAPGHGLTWDHGEAARAGKECLLQLAPDDAPIEGRILDLEGEPIAGVQVAVRSITAAAENIDEWIKKARENPAQAPPIEERYWYYYKPSAQPIARFPTQDSLELDHPKLANATATDASGRFRLTGLGSKRLVRMEVSGAGIAKGWINAVTYSMEPVPYPEYDPRYRFNRCFGARFDAALAPEQRIKGVVRDAATRRPLSGVEVRLHRFVDFGMGSEPFISDVTDADGRYELTGVAKVSATDRRTTLRLIPPDDQPYFRTDVDVPRVKGLEPIVRDVELKRAIWIRGRVVDERSGKPVMGMVAYYPFLANESAYEYVNFDPGMQGIGPYDHHYETKQDGSFRIPGLPGRGIVVVVADDDGRYPRAQGADSIGGLLRKTSNDPRKVYYLFTADLVNAVREIDPPAGVEEFTCEVRLRPFTPHKVRLLDPNGEPLAGVTVEGLALMPIRGLSGLNVAQPSAIVDLLGLSEDQPRHVLFMYHDRRLAAIARLTVQDFPDDKPKDITLLPTAVITGRLVDEDGKPLAGASASAGLDAGGEDQSPGWIGRWRHARGDRAGADGRFRIELVPPDVRYTFNAYNSATDRGATLPAGPLEPGAKLDMGDITLIPTAAANTTVPQPTPAANGDRFSSSKKSATVKDGSEQKKMPKPADNEKKE